MHVGLFSFSFTIIEDILRIIYIIGSYPLIQLTDRTDLLNHFDLVIIKEFRWSQTELLVIIISVITVEASARKSR